MNKELITNRNQEVEEQLLLRPETAVINSSSSPFSDEPGAPTNRFSLLNFTNRPSCTSCSSFGCSITSASSSSSGSHKRPSENPSAHQPKPKKPNHKDDNSNFLSGFSKIPLWSPPIKPQPSLHRCISDPYCPPIAPLFEEPPHSPTPNLKIESPGTPLSNAIASAKLLSRPPNLKRSVSDPIPSPDKTFSSSCGNPNPEWLRKMRNCIREMHRKWEEVLGYEEASDNADMHRITDNNHDDKNNRINEATMENSEKGFIEAVSVEKKGEALIIHFKCPCGAEYQILLLGGSCYYKLS